MYNINYEFLILAVNIGTQPISTLFIKPAVFKQTTTVQISQLLYRSLITRKLCSHFHSHRSAIVYRLCGSLHSLAVITYSLD